MEPLTSTAIVASLHPQKSFLRPRMYHLTPTTTRTHPQLRSHVCIHALRLGSSYRILHSDSHQRTQKKQVRRESGATVKSSSTCSSIHCLNEDQQNYQVLDCSARCTAQLHPLQSVLPRCMISVPGRRRKTPVLFEFQTHVLYVSQQKGVKQSCPLLHPTESRGRSLSRSLISESVDYYYSLFVQNAIERKQTYFCKRQRHE